MKNLPFVFLAALVYVLPAEADDGWSRIDAESPAPEWRAFQERIASREWVVSDFVEERHFRFRGRPVELTGTVWYGREEGLTLHYHSPRREIIRVEEKGVRQIRADGRDRERTVPERGIDVPSALLSLFRLDFAKLGETFEIEGRYDGKKWGLRLAPRDEEEAPIAAMELAGHDDEVQRILVEQSDDRRIELKFSNIAYPQELDDETRDRVFP